MNSVSSEINSFPFGNAGSSKSIYLLADFFYFSLSYFEMFQTIEKILILEGGLSKYKS